MALPTDAQREAWEDFADASKSSAEETDALDGVERMEKRAEIMEEKLDGD